MIGKRNGNGDDIATEIARIQHEIVAIERIGPPLAERIAAAMRALDEDAAFFQRRVFQPTGALPAEREHYRQIAMRGALLAIGDERIRAAERQRVEAEFKTAGGVGMTVAEREQHLAAMRASLRRLRARQELQWRESEADGELIGRPDVDGEMFLRIDADLQAIAK